MAVLSENGMSYLHVQMVIIQDEDAEACEQKKKIFKDKTVSKKTCISVFKHSSAASVSSNTETQNTHIYCMSMENESDKAVLTPKSERYVCAFDFSESVL